MDRQQQASTERLLPALGLSEEAWIAYLAILQEPFDRHEIGNETLQVLLERGLLRPSVERSLGYAPMPPGTAFTKLMDEHDAEVQRRLRAGRQLRKAFRKISEGPTSGGSAEHTSGVEVYTDINQARDRIYEVFDRGGSVTQFSLEGAYRGTEADRTAAMTSSKASDDYGNRGPNHTVIIDRDGLDTPFLDAHVQAGEARGEKALHFPGRAETLMYKVGTGLVLWRDPHPSREATLLVTAPWALLLADAYCRLIHSLSQPFVSSRAIPRSSPAQEVERLLCLGLTDEQIAARTGTSTRTVGRHVATLMAELGATTRFQAGLLLERRLWAAGQS